MREALIRNVTARFESYRDLVGELDDAAIDERLDLPKHKSLGEHLWCVVGARESYAKALVAGEWSGFGCSMTGSERSEFEEKLASSSRSVLAAIGGVEEWTPTRDELLVALAEHEVMHEGQIIRHMYGVERRIPSSVKWA